MATPEATRMIKLYLEKMEADSTVTEIAVRDKLTRDVTPVSCREEAEDWIKNNHLPSEDFEIVTRQVTAWKVTR